MSMLASGQTLGGTKCYHIQVTGIVRTAFPQQAVPWLLEGSATRLGYEGRACPLIQHVRRGWWRATLRVVPSEAANPMLLSQLE